MLQWIVVVFLQYLREVGPVNLLFTLLVVVETVALETPNRWAFTVTDASAK